MFIISKHRLRHAVGHFSNYTDNGMTVATFGGFDWHIYYNADAGSGNLTGGNDVVITPVPEPAHLLLFGLAAVSIVGLFRRWRRRVRSAESATFPFLNN